MTETTDKYPHLPKSYKGVYPFSLSTTSFIYPDDYIPNISMLGPYIDEIELLLFESNDIESLFPESVVDELNCLARDLNIRYNVHLPTDISISTQDVRLQQAAVDSYTKTIERMLPLAPSTFCLHVPYDEDDAEKNTVKRWRDRVRSNLYRLLGGAIEGSLISIETLDYPVDFIEDIVMELNLSICMDVGHLILYGYDVMDVFIRYSSKISSIHLHGVENTQDHLAIDRLPQQFIQPVIEILKRFTGILSLEVFSYHHLNPSLRILEMWWNDFNTTAK
jgi:sugar phosphate isomerase/epimerase